MFAKELTDKSVEELNTELSNLLKEQMKAKLAHANGALQDVSVLKKLRRDIARVKTVLGLLNAASKKEGD